MDLASREVDVEPVESDLLHWPALRPAHPPEYARFRTRIKLTNPLVVDSYAVGSIQGRFMVGSIHIGHAAAQYRNGGVV